MDFSPLETVSAPLSKPAAGITVGTAAVSLELYKNGQSVAEIAKSRNLAESTIETHLGQALENGEHLDPRGLYTAEEEETMRRAFEGYEDAALKPVFEHLEGRISYGKLRLYRAVNSQLAAVR